jgi:hypothetical protein
VPARLVAQQLAHTVDVVGPTGVLAPGSHRLAGDVRQPVHHDPERLARRVVIGGADLQAREYATAERFIEGAARSLDEYDPATPDPAVIAPRAGMSEV